MRRTVWVGEVPVGDRDLAVVRRLPELKRWLLGAVLVGVRLGGFAGMMRRGREITAYNDDLFD
jgi:hypothetical protein